MSYKLSKPEDFTDVEGYAYKLSRAYSVIYSDLLVALVYIDTAIGVLKDENDDKLMCESMVNVLERFIKNYRDEN